MVNNRAAFFATRANQDFELSTGLLSYQYDLTRLPYYSAMYHFKSVLYPIAHVYHGLKNALRLVEGAFLLLHGLFYEPSSSIPAILRAMLTEAEALVLNACNAVASILSFATRSIATLFNFGYFSADVEPDKWEHTTNEEDENYDTAIGLGFSRQGAQVIEEGYSNATLSL